MSKTSDAAKEMLEDADRYRDRDTHDSMMYRRSRIAGRYIPALCDEIEALEKRIEELMEAKP